MLPDPIWSENRKAWIVKRTATHSVDIVPMIFSYRLVLTPLDSPMGYDVGWCYFGLERAVFSRCMIAAMHFDPDTEEAPAWFDKQLGRWDPPGVVSKAASGVPS